MNLSLAFGTVEARFHKRAQVDLDQILRRYREISHQLRDDFFAEFHIGMRKVVWLSKIPHGCAVKLAFNVPRNWARPGA